MAILRTEKMQTGIEKVLVPGTLVVFVSLQSQWFAARMDTNLTVEIP